MADKNSYKTSLKVLLNKKIQQVEMELEGLEFELVNCTNFIEKAEKEKKSIINDPGIPEPAQKDLVEAVNQFETVMRAIKGHCLHDIEQKTNLLNTFKSYLVNFNL